MEILRFFCSGLAALSLLSATAKSTVIDMNEPPAALSGRNIALWQSHGRSDAERTIAYSDYAIEADAVEDGDYSEDAADFQSASDPYLYPVGTLIDYANHKPDLKRISHLVEQYIPEQSENLYAE